MNLSLIAHQIRDQDYDRYLACLFAPKRLRAGLFSLLAYHCEIAKTAEAASEPPIGAIRLKWWMEAVEEAYGGGAVREHPVVCAMAETLPKNLPKAALLQLAEARMADIEQRQGFETQAEFEYYLRDTAGTLHTLMAMLASETFDRETVEKAARIYAIMGLLRAIPAHAERGIIRWPRDILKQFGLSPAAIEQGVEAEALRHFVRYWLGDIAHHAGELKDDIKALPDSVSFIKRLHVITLLYANRLKEVDGDLSQLPARLPNLPLKLWLGKAI